MATTSKALFRGAATTNTATTLYTTPAGSTAIVTNISVTNTAGTAGTFTLALAGTALHTTTSIAANTTVYIDCKQVLTATQTITGGASATSINFHISGVEVN
jgi:hypothetical protein